MSATWSPRRVDGGEREASRGQGGSAVGGVENRDDLVVAGLRSMLARRHALPVGDVHVDAAVDQRSHGLDMGVAAVAEDDRLEQRRPAEAVDVIEVDPGLDQAPRRSPRTRDARLGSSPCRCSCPWR